MDKHEVETYVDDTIDKKAVGQPELKHVLDRLEQLQTGQDRNAARIDRVLERLPPK